MALKDYIQDPDEAKTGYAGYVMEAVKLAAMVASCSSFAVGLLLKNRLETLADASFGSLAFTFALLFVVLFGGLWFTVKDLPALCREKDNHPKAKDVTDGHIAGLLYGQYAFSFSVGFFFAVAVEATAAIVNPLFAGNYMLEYPAAIFFFYAVAPAIIVNVAFMSWMRTRVARLPQD